MVNLMRKPLAAVGVVVVSSYLLCGTHDARGNVPYDVQSARRRDDLSPVLPLEADAWHRTSYGSRCVVISGDPSKQVSFMMRVRLPPGYRLSPRRWHNDQQIVVLAGEVEVGTGSVFDPHATRTLSGGSFILLSASEAHFVTTKRGAVLEVFGVGPFAM